MMLSAKNVRRMQARLYILYARSSCHDTYACVSITTGFAITGDHVSLGGRGETSDEGGGGGGGDGVGVGAGCR